jgi:hypothetical protein
MTLRGSGRATLRASRVPSRLGRSLALPGNRAAILRISQGYLAEPIRKALHPVATFAAIALTFPIVPRKSQGPGTKSLPDPSASGTVEWREVGLQRRQPPCSSSVARFQQPRGFNATKEPNVVRGKRDERTHAGLGHLNRVRNLTKRSQVARCSLPPVRLRRKLESQNRRTRPLGLTERTHRDLGKRDERTQPGGCQLSVPRLQRSRSTGATNEPNSWSF